MNVCIQPTDGNLGPSVMVWGTIHHGGRSELVGLDGTLNRQCYIRFLDDSMLPRATGVFWTKLWLYPGQCHAPCSTWHNNCFSGTTWCEGYGRASSWTRHEHHWAWLGPNGCLDPRHGWPLSTVPELRYAVPQGRAAVCARRVRTLFEGMPYRVPVPVAARGHTMYYCCGDMAVSMFNRFIETMVICHLVFFHDAIIWMCCFSTVELPKHYFLLFYQLQGQNEIGAQHFYQLWKPDIEKMLLNNRILPNLNLLSWDVSILAFSPHFSWNIEHWSNKKSVLCDIHINYNPNETLITTIRKPYMISEGLGDIMFMCQRV